MIKLFNQSLNDQYYEEDHLRFPRQPEDLPPLDEDYSYSTDQENPRRSSPSDSVPIFLPFPGTEPNRRPRSAPKSELIIGIMC